MTTKGNSPFKGKSFDIVTPLNSSIIDILTNSLQGASNKAWMQFSAYGVCTHTLHEFTDSVHENWHPLSSLPCSHAEVDILAMPAAQIHCAC